MENLVILGTGIAGLTAAIYAARANLSPLIISGPEDGGQLTLTSDVENFPGFPEGIKGPELIDRCKKQAERFGAKFKLALVEKINKKKDFFTITLDDKTTLETKSIIIATGASARWLGIPSEEKYKGRGVSTCATCDAAFYKNKEVVVIGGGDSAMEEANFLTKFANKVTIIHRREKFSASVIMQKKTLSNPKIKTLWNKEVQEVLGDGKKVTGVKLKDSKTSKAEEYSSNGVFLAIGHIPNTGFLRGFVDLDEKGYLKADNHMHTSVPGVFAAGDVQDYNYRQAITAAGTGCVAALEVEKYLSGHQ